MRSILVMTIVAAAAAQPDSLTESLLGSSASASGNLSSKLSLDEAVSLCGQVPSRPNKRKCARRDNGCAARGGKCKPTDTDGDGVKDACACKLKKPRKEPSRVCRDGATKQVDCNTCYCQGGQWQCTLMLCPDSNGFIDLTDPYPCATVLCADPGCGPSLQYIPEGECCPRCRFATPGSPSETQVPCNEVQCFVNPCDVARCPNFPDATCVPNYCGGCNADFYTPDGNLLTEDDCRSATGAAIAVDARVDARDLTLPTDPCATVRCADPGCRPRQQYTPEGECCPRCRVASVPRPTWRPITDVVLPTQRPTPFWRPIDELAIPTRPPAPTPRPGPVAALDLTAAIIAPSNIGSFIPTTDPCATVLCADPQCGPDQIEYVPEGKCCPKCSPSIRLPDLDIIAERLDPIPDLRGELAGGFNLRG